jgi:hypothetical protein
MPRCASGGAGKGRTLRLEPLGQLGAAVAFVCEFRDQQSERLDVPGRCQRTDVGRLEPRVTNQPRRNLLRLVVVFFASSSAPEEVWATTSSVSASLMGSEQVSMTLPATTPA